MSRDFWAPDYNRGTLIFHHSKFSYYPGATLLWICTTGSSASYTKQPKFSRSTWFIFNAAMKDIEHIPWTPGMIKSAPSLGGWTEYFLTILFFLWLVWCTVNKSNWGGSRNHLTMSPDRMSLFTKQGRSIGLIMFCERSLTKSHIPLVSQRLIYDSLLWTWASLLFHQQTVTLQSQENIHYV